MVMVYGGRWIGMLLAPHLVVRRREASVLGMEVKGRLVGNVLLVLYAKVNHVRHRKLARVSDRGREGFERVGCGHLLLDEGTATHVL